jgi:hypothetical protein
MSEKQTTFFTINCAENLESPNQCERESSSKDNSNGKPGFSEKPFSSEKSLNILMGNPVVHFRPSIGYHGRQLETQHLYS